MSREISTSVPDDAYAILEARAHAYGFFGKYAVSQYVRFAAFVLAGLDAPPIDRGVRQIVVTPANAEKLQWYEDYALLKNFPNVESYALYAVGGMTKKVPLTADEAREYAELLAKRRGA